MKTVETHIKKYMPAFATPDLIPNEFHHMDPDGRKHFSREKAQEVSAVSGRPLKANNISFAFPEVGGNNSTVCFDEA